MTLQARTREMTNMSDKEQKIIIPGLGEVMPDSGLVPLSNCSDGYFKTGENGVNSIHSTGDGKVELIAFKGKTLAYVNSIMGYPAYYPVHPVKLY
jgi:beta-phosphoglucomutase